jgi:hypothetical protein
VTSPPPTLAFLAWNWGDAYLFSYVRDRWVALRRDARYFLTAHTLAELATMVEDDYQRNPVPRAYDPPGPAAYPDLAGVPALPEGGDYAGDDAELDAETLIIVRELRRAFPLWKIIYCTQTHTWIGRTRKTTISNSSAVALCISLTLIERRERQIASSTGWNRPPRDGGTPA